MEEKWARKAQKDETSIKEKVQDVGCFFGLWRKCVHTGAH